MLFKNIPLLLRRVTKQTKFFCKLLSTQHLLKKEMGDKAVLTLNRPQSLNAINYALLTDLYESLREMEKRKSLIIIKGTGDRAFSAGGDILEAHNITEIEKVDQVVMYVHALNEMLCLLHSYKVPLVVFMDGIAFGGGAGISSLSKYSVATERTVFGMPESRIAFHPNAGGTYFLNRTKGNLGYYLALTGNSLKGFDVFKTGLATHFCYSHKLPDLEKALLASTSTDVEEVLGTICEKCGPDLSLSHVIDKIDRCFSEPTIEDIVAKLQEDDSVWAEKTFKLLEKLSPSSLKVTLRQMQKGPGMKVDECLLMESNLSINCYKKPDVWEGVRVTLVDKGDVPKWTPSRLIDVTEELVESYFQPHQEEELREVIRNLKNR